MAARRRIWPWIRRLVFCFLIGLSLVGAGLAGLWSYLGSHLPIYGGERPLPILTRAVSVWRTDQAVPLIEADNWPDAWRALGYLHAEDRLFQMDLTRRIAQGRLAELVGPPGVASDRLMRVLGFAAAAKADFAELSPAAKTALTAYAEGVNGWIAAQPSPWPIEYHLLMTRPERWQPEDGLLWGKLMAWQLSGNHRAELENAALMQRLGPRASAYMRTIGDAPVTLSDAKDAKPPLAAADADMLPAGIDWTKLFAGLSGSSGPDRASNMFIVAGNRSVTGHPILANDPHLGLAAPILWYPASLRVGAEQLSGVTVPGVPFVILGHSESTAWGMTTTGSDTQDLVVETLDRGDPGRIVTAAGAATLETEEQTIRVRFAPDVKITVRRSPRGPIISDAYPAMAATLGEGRLLALQWSYLKGRDHGADALLGMNRARDWASFSAAARQLAGPQQNIGYADARGTIALIAPARLPQRAAGQDGRLPRDGTLAAADWAGLMPAAAAPMIQNPPAGVISTANNPLVGPAHPFLRGDWASGWRESRQRALLAQFPRLSADDATAIQTDRRAPDAARLLPLLESARAAGGGDGMRARALDLLAGWSGVMARDRAEPLIYQAWLWQLQDRLIRRPLGALGRHRVGIEHDRLIQILTDNPAACNDPATPAVEDCPALLASTLDEALRAIARTQGPEPGTWRWGTGHPAMFRHLLFGRMPGLSGLFGRRIETGGGGTALDRGDLGQVRAEGAVQENGHAAGYRAVYDLADTSRSRLIIPTGVSGNPLSPWYDNLLVLWRNGGYMVLPHNDAVQRQAPIRLRLLPLRPEPGQK